MRTFTAGMISSYWFTARKLHAFLHSPSEVSDTEREREREREGGKEGRREGARGERESVCVCVCVCVRDREIESERERESVIGTKGKWERRRRAQKLTY